jgi:hypothetical protein
MELRKLSSSTYPLTVPMHDDDLDPVLDPDGKLAIINGGSLRDGIRPK